MIIPYSTDAPIYHFPRATLGMIAANVAVHLAWSYSSPEAAEPFAMKLGAGLHPLQWLTHNFLHADFLHLGFNMIFLWSYGIIVEGKVGWWPFLLCYLGIGTAHGAAIQAAYLHAEPTYVLGASAIVFGLMAMGMLWAPANELSCFYFFFVGFRVLTGTFEWPIYAFALLQLGLQGLEILLMSMIRGDPMSSGFLHVSGAFWGLLVGAAMLRLRLVDCEGWDVFSLMTRNRELREAWRRREAQLDRSKLNEALPRAMLAEESRPGLAPEERSAKLLAKAQRAIADGDPDEAQAAVQAWLAVPGHRPGREALLGLIKALHARGAWAASVPAMRAFCRLHPERAEKVRLKLASILIRHLDRPTEARRHLDQVADAALEPALRATRWKLLEEADRRIEEGVLEVEEDA